MEDAIILGIVGITMVGIMEIAALMKGINGKRLATSVAIVGTIAGFAFGVGVS